MFFLISKELYHSANGIGSQTNVLPKEQVSGFQDDREEHIMED